MTELNPLSAVSPIDGRYASKTSSLRDYFSEYALIRYRTRVEIEYFIALCGIPPPQLANFGKGTGKSAEELFKELRSIYLDMTPEAASRVKEIEKTTNHDVKAVEYLIKEHFDRLGLSAWKEFIHFGLTSQDINNTSWPSYRQMLWSGKMCQCWQRLMGSRPHPRG